MKWNPRHGEFATTADAAWHRNRFGRFVAVTPSPSRVLRRELEAFLGRRLSGRQWVKWRKQQRREEQCSIGD